METMDSEMQNPADSGRGLQIHRSGKEIQLMDLRVLLLLLILIREKQITVQLTIKL